MNIRVRQIPPLLRLGFLACFLTTLSCAAAHNYLDPAGPRYAGGPPEVRPTIAPAHRSAPLEVASDSTDDPAATGTSLLHVVTFNIQFARHVDRAIRLIEGDPRLRSADVIFLQEMDAPGVRRIAEALGLHWVYYPATRHPQTGRDFGPALLSRRPIRDDRKILLPHFAAVGRTQRIAVAGTIDVDGIPVRLYSVHFAVWLANLPMQRWRQAATVRDDARRHRGPVIVAGDLNQERLGWVFANAGFAWTTKGAGATTRGLELDHIFVRGGGASAGAEGDVQTETRGEQVGVVRDNLGSSDHRPVWATIRLDRAGSLASPRLAHRWGRPVGS